MATPKVNIIVGAKTAEADRKLKGLGRTFGGFKDLLAAGGAIAAIRAFGSALVGSVQASIESERAVRSLEASLRATGELTEQASEQIQEYAKSLAASNATTDEAVSRGFALAQSFTGNVEASKELIAASFDFAAAADLNFTEALRRLGRATQGSTADIANYVPEVRELTKAQLEAGEATRIVAERFKGLGAEAIDPTQRSISLLAEGWDDLNVEIGKTLKQTIDLPGKTNFLLTAFANLREGIRALRQGQEFYAKATDESSESQEEFRKQTLLTKGELDAFERSIKASTESQKEFFGFLSDIGVTTTAEVTEEVRKLEEGLRDADERLRDGRITYQDFEKIQKATAAAISEAKGQLVETTSAVDDYGIGIRASTVDLQAFNSEIERNVQSTALQNSELERQRVILRGAGGGRIGSRLPASGSLFPGLSGSSGVFTVPPQQPTLLPTGRIIFPG